MKVRDIYERLKKYDPGLVILNGKHKYIKLSERFFFRKDVNQRVNNLTCVYDRQEGCHSIPCLMITLSPIELNGSRVMTVGDLLKRLWECNPDSDVVSYFYPHDSSMSSAIYFFTSDNGEYLTII